MVLSSFSVEWRPPPYTLRYYSTQWCVHGNHGRMRVAHLHANLCIVLMATSACELEDYRIACCTSPLSNVMTFAARHSASVMEAVGGY